MTNTPRSDDMESDAVIDASFDSIENEIDNENWPRRLNRILIAVGVVAFGLIIADRLISIYKTEDAASSLAAVDSEITDSASKAESSELVAGQESPIVRGEEAGDLQAKFGSKLLFVSLAAPQFVITEDERRFDVGSSIDEQTTLAEITDNQVILDNSGTLTAYDLPEPVAAQ